MLKVIFSERGTKAGHIELLVSACLRTRYVLHACHHVNVNFNETTANNKRPRINLAGVIVMIMSTDCLLTVMVDKMSEKS